MNKFLLTIGLISALAVTTISAMAESTIYTDGIGRMHFLGKEPGSNTKDLHKTERTQSLVR